MFCPNCGNKIENGSKFCSKCGEQTATIEPESTEDSTPITNDQKPTESQPFQNEQPPTYQQGVTYNGYTPQPPHGQSFTQGAAPKKRKTILFVVLGLILLLIIGIGVFVVVNVVDSFRDFSSNSTIDSKPLDIDDYFESDSDILEDIVANSSWLSNDSSYLVFDDERTFHWYKVKSDLTDNYYTGDYEFYIGEEALLYITLNLSAYGVTADEMMGVIERSDEYEIDELVCFVLNNESCIVDGAETITETVVSPYYGFLLNDGTYLDVANMNTASYLSFEKE